MENQQESKLGKKMTLSDYVPAFAEALAAQLEKDEKRWGDTWQHRPREGQEERTEEKFRDYFDQYHNGGVPVPWLKIAGAALICWVRDQNTGENGQTIRS